MPDYGLDVSRTLPIRDTSFIGTVHLKLTPSVDAEHNLDTDLADFNASQRARLMAFSGVINRRASGHDKVFISTLDSEFVGNYGLHPNEFAIQNCDVFVNGWSIPIRGSRVNGGNFDDLDWLSIELPTAPAPSPLSRQDLVYLEVWRALIYPTPSAVNKPSASEVFRHGNVQYAGANLADDLIQPDIGARTSLRTQLQYRIRVAPGVDFEAYPDGINDPNVYAQGGATTSSNTWRFAQDPHDPGLYIAGDGTALAQSELGNVDGLVYAIPLAKVHRRNSSAYSLNNPNGSSSDITDPVSDRPDGLYFDEVSLRDLVDLRHDVVTHKSFSEMLEHNFDALLRRDLKVDFGKDPTIDSQIQGTEMLTVDGYSVIDQNGVHDLPFDPDSLRRDYSGEARIHEVVYQVDTSVNVTSGPIQFNTATNLLSISIPNGNVQNAPTIWVAGIQQAGAVPGGWVGTIPGGVLQGTLDAGVVGNLITVRLEIAYEPVGHRFVATNYYRVNNGRLVNPEDWTYVVNPVDFTTTRERVIANPPVVAGEPHQALQYPPVTIDNSGAILYPPNASGSTLSHNSKLEVYDYLLLGNGTIQYALPDQIEGREVLGIYEVFETDASAIFYTQIDPASVTRNINGTFTVNLGTSYTTAKILKFRVVTQQTGTTLDRSTKGLKEIMTLKWYTIDGNGGTTYTVETTNVPYGLASRRTAGLTEQFYAYVAGSLVLIDNNKVNKSLNTVTLEFDSPVSSGDEIRFFVMEGYSATTDDRVQISYDRLPYQGLSKHEPLEGARVLAVGRRPLIHSVGTSRETTFKNQEMFALSEVLPLGFGFLDTDLQNAELGLDHSQFTSFRMLYLPFLSHDYRTGSSGKLAVQGDTIQLTDVLVEPVRGVKNKALNLVNSLELTDYPMELVTPTLLTSQTHQVVQYYLVHSPVTHQLYMLVVTAVNTSTGGDLVKSSVAETGVAYDLYQIKGKPLLKI